MPETVRGIHYRVDDIRAPWAGDALPVLFNHGIGTTHDIWAGWVPAIAARRPMLRFDMRGFGRSVVPPVDHVWSMDELIADLWSVADAAGAGRVHLMGESMGGTIVLAAALARPERVASVSISNASYKGKGIGELAYWRDQFAAGGPEGWSGRMMGNRFNPGHGDPAALDWFQHEQARTQPHVALGLGGVLAASDLTGPLRAAPFPLSVVLPDSSPFVPPLHGAELREIVPDCRLRVVPGVRHGLPFSHAAEEAAQLAAWVDAVEAA